MKKIFLFIILGIGQCVIAGQTIQNEPEFKWNFSLSAGMSFPLKNPDFSGITEALISEGLISDFFEVDRKISKHLSIGFSSGSATFKKSSFYSSPNEARVKILEISPLIQYDFINILAIGGGPVFYYL